MKKKIIALLLCVMTVFAFAACGGNPVATVNGVDIPQEAYQEQLDYMMASYGFTGDMSMTSAMAEMLQSQTINGLVYTEELKQACEAEGCLPTDEETEEYLFAALGVADKAAYKEGIATVESYYGLSQETFESMVLSELYNEKLGNKLAEDQGLTASDEEAQTTYEEDPDSYNTRTVSHILITPEVTEGREAEVDEAGQTIYTDEEWAAAKAEAMDVLAQLDEGADFAELAKEVSDDPGSAEMGGALGGAFTKTGSTFVPEFTDGSFALTAVDEYTKEPVKSSYGYHIILCTGIQDADNDFEGLINGIKDNLLAQLKQEAVSTYMEEFEANSEIVIYYGPEATEAE